MGPCTLCTKPFWWCYQKRKWMIIFRIGQSVLTSTKHEHGIFSVTGLGYMLVFGRLFKACGHNIFAHIARIFGQFLKTCQNYLIFCIEGIFGQLFYWRWATFYSGLLDALFILLVKSIMFSTGLHWNVRSAIVKSRFLHWKYYIYVKRNFTNGQFYAHFSEISSPWLFLH